MPISISYALFPLANTECCQLPLCSLPRHVGCPCSALMKPSESYSTFQLRSKTTSSGDQGTEFRDNKSSLLSCVYMGSFTLCFVLSFHRQIWIDDSRRSREAGAKRPRRGATCGLVLKLCYISLTPSALACYVGFVTGNKRKHDEETQ